MSLDNPNEVLDFIKKSGIVNIDDVQVQMTKAKKEVILRQHIYRIWQGEKDKRWRTYLPDELSKSKRKLVAKTSLDDLKELIIDFYESQEREQQLSEYTLRQLYPKWKNYKSLHTTASNYITRIESDWKKYYLNTEIIDIPIKKFTKIQLDEWAHTLIKTYEMTKNQYYNMSVIMRQGLDYAVDLEIIPKNPFSLVKIDGKRLFRKVKKKPNETQVFFDEDIRQIQVMAWDDYNNHVKIYDLAPLAVLFQLETGLRLGELCAIRYEDLDRNNYIHIQRMLRRDTKEVVQHTKSYDDRYAFLTRSAKHLIETAKNRQIELGIKSDGYIFSLTNEALNYHSVPSLYEKYCRHLGITHKSSHKARKTYISKLIDGQVNINTIRELVGHADERTTFQSYCFDRHTNDEKVIMIERALA